MGAPYLWERVGGDGHLSVTGASASGNDGASTQTAAYDTTFGNFRFKLESMNTEYIKIDPQPE